MRPFLLALLALSLCCLLPAGCMASMLRLLGNQHKTFNASSAKLPWVAWGRRRLASRTRSQQLKLGLGERYGAVIDQQAHDLLGIHRLASML